VRRTELKDCPPEVSTILSNDLAIYSSIKLALKKRTKKQRERDDYPSVNPNSDRQTRAYQGKSELHKAN